MIFKVWYLKKDDPTKRSCLMEFSTEISKDPRRVLESIKSDCALMGRTFVRYELIEEKRIII